LIFRRFAAAIERLERSSKAREARFGAIN
jgi:hypothetical protein